MKRPLTPFHSPGSGICGSLAENSCMGSPPEQRTKREKKHPSFTLCEVCNIQLNSAVQAQIHFSGKSHQKRLKHLNKGKVLSSPGPANHNSSLLASLPIPGRSLHPSLDIKHFLTFRLNGTPPLNLFPNFNTMDPVQKAVINHTFGVPNPLKKKQFISCNICHLRFNSANQAEAHYRGHKHARRLKAIEAVKNKHKTADNSSSSSQEKMANFEAALDISRDTITNSSRGAKHKLMLEGQTVLPRRSRGKVLSRVAHKPKRIGSKGSLNIQNKAFQCQVCEIFVNSETQLKQHMSSRRHKDRLAGKPPKPKYSPYSKLQRNTALAVSILKSKVALQKHLTKTLAARFLPSPLASATVCTLPSPLTLRPAAATLFQAPIFGPALFRSPPGPVRAATGPIVFAPY
ncbi:zinc finger protein 385C isoform X6 [Crotalus tigris]|uniref:zinc finger protein 385C isoform X6 n=1 Tax=Crotalus tigris TaxID=88082 RepID=UPI00192F4FB0|nr:zinc finger protein 385C isoform X6 [Crotalus tigris]